MLVQGSSGGSLFLLTLFVVWKKRPLLPVLPFLLMTGCCSLWVLVDAMRVLAAYTGGPVHIVSPTAGMLVVFTGWTVWNFGAHFHSDTPVVRTRLLIGSLAAALLVSGLCWTDNWSFNRRFDKGMPIADNGWPYFVTASYAFLQILAGVFLLARRFVNMQQPIKKAQILYCILGIVIFTVCAYIFSLVLPVFGLKHLFFLGPSSGIIFVGILAWAILTRQFFSLRLAAFNFLFAFFYLVCFSAASAAYFAYASPDSPDPNKLYAACIVFAILSYLYLQKLGPYLERRVTRYLIDVEELVRAVVNASTSLSLKPYHVLLLRIAHTFRSVLRLENAVVFYQRENSEIHALAADGKNERIQKILRKHPRIFGSISPRLFQENAPAAFWVEDITSTELIVDARKYPKIARSINAFRDDLMALGIDLYLPVSYQGRYLAHIFLGRKKSGEPFYRKEVARISGIAGVIAVACKNNQVFTELFNLKESLKTENEALIDSSSLLTEKIIALSEERKIIYSGPGMEAVIDSINNTAKNEETVLVLGESGTGKELVALLIHEKSARNKKPFRSINCGSLNETLLESELFGHEKGSFTGAVEKHQGVFEQALGGTLFLDEVGEMTPPVQVKFLRVLQERKITRVGGSQEIKVDVRIVGATNANLERLVSEGKFRLDLFYRLNVIKIVVPPLRARREDIPVLVEHCLNTFGEKLGKGRMRITADAMRLLVNYEWPGNVRQLENMLLRAIVNARATTLTEKDFLEIQGHSMERSPITAIPSASPLAAPFENLTMLEKSEYANIQTAIKKSAGNKSNAARLLGLSRSTFYLKLRKYGLD
ncbi:MAG: sigma 54-interacting transcriptional regulator [Spirochaetia bacterium]|nr:sigma 54-interacting transcriptional regulator [Spirochaetia bacterium]